MAFTLTASVAQTEYKSKKEGWEVKMVKAVELSKASGKPILANFTGTDWCGWCIKLDNTVFKKPEFQKWAKENVVLLELDFPRRSKLPQEIAKQNAELQKAFNVRGFPTIWVFDASQNDGDQGFSINALGQTGFARTVGDFTSAVDQMISKRGK